MIVVIICNVVKAVCTGLMLRRRDSKPLVILGDAVTSFLDFPDPFTDYNYMADKERYVQGKGKD